MIPPFAGMKADHPLLKAVVEQAEKEAEARYRKQFDPVEWERLAGEIGLDLGNEMDRFKMVVMTGNNVIRVYGDELNRSTRGVLDDVVIEHVENYGPEGGEYRDVRWIWQDPPLPPPYYVNRHERRAAKARKR